MINRRLLSLVVAIAGLLIAWVVVRSLWKPASSTQETRSAETAHVGETASPNFTAPQNPSSSVAPETSATPLRSQKAGVVTGAGSPLTGAAATANVSPASDNSASPTPPNAKIEVEKVRLMIRSYHNVMGENPVGTNAEIMQALMGRNPKQAQLGPPDGQSLNEKGELTDQWGTPFFFHQLSKDSMEIRSAGPDKVMGTTDDSVSR